MKFYSSLLLVLFCLTAISCEGQSTPADRVAEQRAVIKQSLRYSDWTTAIGAIHRIIALEGENSTYVDSLALAYFQVGAYNSAGLVARERLLADSTDEIMLEVYAKSLLEVEAGQRAVSAYERLFALNNGRADGYELANLQYRNRMLEPARATLDQVNTLPDDGNWYVQIDKGDQTGKQNVPLQAAIENLAGLIAYEAGDPGRAEARFEAALEIMPEFGAAKANLADVRKAAKE